MGKTNLTEVSAPTVSFYLPQIDGLRFIAALLVFIHYAPVVPGFAFLHTYGWVGVDIFLCISAFLLTKLLALEFSNYGNIKIGHFLVRRALRVWPLYIFYSTCACVMAVIAFGEEISTAFAWWLSHLTFSNNIMTALNGYSPISFSAHLWTISLEEQIYIILPFLLLPLFSSGVGRNRIALYAATIIAVLILARLGFYLIDAPHPFVWVLPLRADSFVAGCVLALFFQGRESKYPMLWFVAGVLLISSAALFSSIQERSLYQVFGYTIISCGCVLLLYAANSSLISGTILAAKPMRYLGKISYGIYVYHVVCLAIASKALAYMNISNHLTITVLGLLVTIVISAASYMLLEKPFLRLKSKFLTVASRPI